MVQFILNRDYASVTAVHSGEWMNRLTSDTVVVADSVSQILPGASGMLIRLVGALVLLLMLYPKFVYVFIPGGLIILLTTTIFRKKLKKLHKEVQEADGGLRVFLQECISSLLVIHTFAQEKRTVEEAGEKMEQRQGNPYQAKSFFEFYEYRIRGGDEWSVCFDRRSVRIWNPKGDDELRNFDGDDSAVWSDPVSGCEYHRLHSAVLCNDGECGTSDGD